MSSEANFLAGYKEAPLPLRVRDAKRGVGSFLTIELDEVPNAGAHWRIWIYLCDWVLTEGEAEVLDSNCTDNRFYADHLGKLIGADLTECVAIDANKSCRLSFSSGAQLTLDDASDIYGPDKDMFMIFQNDECVASFKPIIGLILGDESG
jgi:hypothetical protein